MTSKNNRNQWLEHLTQDFGGGWGLGLGSVMTVYGVLMGYDAFLAMGLILTVFAAALAIASALRK